MTSLHMTPQRWLAARRLAAELAQRDFDANVLKTAVAYLKAYPNADIHDWLEKLVHLGNIFSSSDQTHLYRHTLREVCRRLEPAPAGPEWGIILAWAARLLTCYQVYPNQARQIYDVSGIKLPPLPQPFKPDPPQRQTPLPEVEEASQEANDLLAQMQAIWASRDK